jgi:hypothetical protein
VHSSVADADNLMDMDSDALPPSGSARLILGLIGATAAAAVAMPAWSGTLALDARAGTLAAVLYGAVVARGWWLAARTLERDDLVPLCAVTLAGLLGGEWIVARFAGSRSATAPLLVFEHAFREPPSWAALALAAGLLGVWIAGRSMAAPGAMQAGRPGRIPLARAVPRTTTD